MASLMDVTMFILKGSLITAELFFITAVFSVPLGCMVAIGKISKIKPLRALLGLYTWAFRGTPLLLQLFFAYFGLPVIGIRLSPLSAAGLAFTINYAAYLAEIFRGGIESIDKGQYEAAKVLGMNYYQTMTKIIIPQTARNVLPPVCNESINLIKDSALVATIGVGDLLRAAKEVVTRDFTITPFIIAAVIYLIITSVLVIAFRHLEKKYSID
ncbi:MAG: amino acid ABC transporter permease [Clostridium luticellarii]|uniref:Inner membrane amino-acid ABC transporter permease protein YecS n=2 Tax=Clostridium luticellarii TaxID=1691940 RepID=A0A2T0BDT2_9CLOT|nr:amino acid ABC transporter permease [Clostridium luticellarii]MCI1944239.1 amino acid ABC transporter permease [Clostridium luticellarii]MCI1967735.1 amino acid ABC transporter permease [Clostridium luticellarii]MCI1994613.1 amino acid ABC transporter permease [Clostridium luticellarii]MCI2038890.1 amino acid ABC transporter permease [Clostridium luticellarii]PRR82049.1 Inner membrane amino-acid ABC transporter permease protein YecS [Clostridium luticellarii]